MFWFKDCPKCNGDLYLAADRNGPEVSCIQCGYELSLEDLAKFGLTQTAPPVATNASTNASEHRVGVGAAR